MGGSSKKGSDDVDVPQINPQQLIDQAIAANRVNVNTPFGSQTYNGNTLTTQLSPEMQALFAKQMALAGSPANTYTLPGQSADILNGLQTRLNQRYGIALPPSPNASGGNSAPGVGGGGTPTPVPPTQQPPQQPQPPPGGYTPGNGLPSYTQPDPSFGGELYTPRGQAGGGAHYGEEWVGGMCVAVDSWLPYDLRADQVKQGDLFPVHTPEEGFHKWQVQSVGDAAFVPCVEMKTLGGAVLRCSMTTPFNLIHAQADLKDAWKYAPDMVGESVFVQTPAGVVEDEVTNVTDIGRAWVQPISFGGRSFPAGDTQNALIYSHNIVKDNAANVSGVVYGFGDSGLSGSNQLSGIIDQSHDAAANFGFGPNAQGTMEMIAPYTPQQQPQGQAPAGFGLPQNTSGPMPAMPKLPMPDYLKRNWLDSPWAKAGALLLGPAATLGLGITNKIRHRNDQ